MDSSHHIAAALAALLLLFPLTVAAVKVGDPAPEFALPDQNGKLVKLSDFRGKRTVVLAFYLRASTPG